MVALFGNEVEMWGSEEGWGESASAIPARSPSPEPQASDSWAGDRCGSPEHRPGSS